MFSFVRNLHTIFQSDCTILHSLQQWMRVPVAPQPHQLLVMSVFRIFVILICVYFIVVVAFLWWHTMWRGMGIWLANQLSLWKSSKKVSLHWIHFCRKSSITLVVQLLSYVQLFCNPMDCSPPGSPVHEILQARILEWVAISFARGSSWPRNGTHISYIGQWILYHWATKKAPSVTLGSI